MRLEISVPIVKFRQHLAKFFCDPGILERHDTGKQRQNAGTGLGVGTGFDDKGRNKRAQQNSPRVGREYQVLTLDKRIIAVHHWMEASVPKLAVASRWNRM
jgi:hypothetical protein